MVAPRVLAIDLAARKSGIACLADSLDRPVVWTFDAGSKPGHARDTAIIMELRRAVDLCGPEVIVLEELYVPPPSQLGDGFKTLAFLHGIVRYYLSGVAPWLAIKTSHLKMYALGKGTGAGTDKHDVMLAVERRYHHLISIEDDNQSDAFILAALARHHYGHPVSTVDGKDLPQTHTRAVGLVNGWPDLVNGPKVCRSALCSVSAHQHMRRAGCPGGHDLT